MGSHGLSLPGSIPWVCMDPGSSLCLSMGSYHAHGVQWGSWYSEARFKNDVFTNLISCTALAFSANSLSSKVSGAAANASLVTDFWKSRRDKSFKKTNCLKSSIAYCASTILPRFSKVTSIATRLAVVEESTMAHHVEDRLGVCEEQIQEMEPLRPR